MWGKGTKVGKGENNPGKNPKKYSGFLRSGLFCSGNVRGAVFLNTGVNTILINFELISCIFNMLLLSYL